MEIQLRVGPGPCPAPAPPARRASVRVARGLALAGLAGSLTLAGCTSTVTGSGTPAQAAAPAPSGAGDPSGGPSPSPSGSPPATGASGPVTYHKLSLVLPPDWRLVPAPSSACLSRGDQPDGTCTVQIVDLDAAATAHAPVQAPKPGQPLGWWMNPAQPACASSAVSGSTVVTSSFVKMRNKTAAYSAWRVTCANPAQNFSPRLWWLPVTKVALVQNRGGVASVDSQVDQLVASVSVTG